MYLEKIIDVETALLVKECGFPQLDEINIEERSDISTYGTYDEGSDKSWELDPMEADEYMTAPTHGQLHTWVRNTHNLVVNVDHMEGQYFFMVTHITDHSIHLDNDEEYDTYEEGMERGLFAALMYIKDEG